MKLATTLAVLTTAFSFGACAQSSDLSGATTAGSSGGYANGTTSNAGALGQAPNASAPAAAGQGTAAYGQSNGTGSAAYGTAGSQTTSNGVNPETGTMPSQGPSVNAVNGAAASLPSNQAVPGSVQDTQAGSLSGTTSAPASDSQADTTQTYSRTRRPSTSGN